MKHPIPFLKTPEKQNLKKKNGKMGKKE